jgi:hypothetical protein
MAAAKPGFSADGTFIENPTALLEATVPGLTGAARGANAAKSSPIFEKIKGTSLANDMLGEKSNQKTFQDLPGIGLSRVSASAENLNCWFDSFLQCMSPKYRSLDLTGRGKIRVGFRKYLGQENVLNAILAQKPTKHETFTLVFTDFTDEKFKKDIRGETVEAGRSRTDLDSLSGFLIAWYFGVNLIYLKRNSEDTLEMVCETAYQSPDCKTIFMCNIGAYHFEPVGKVVLTDDRKLLEGDGGSKFLFSWTDTDLCALKGLSMRCKGYPEWTVSASCAPTNGTQQGGRRKRRTMKKRRLTKRKRTLKSKSRRRQ